MTPLTTPGKNHSATMTEDEKRHFTIIDQTLLVVVGICLKSKLKILANSLLQKSI